MLVKIEFGDPEEEWGRFMHIYRWSMATIEKFRDDDDEDSPFTYAAYKRYPLLNHGYDDPIYHENDIGRDIFTFDNFTRIVHNVFREIDNIGYLKEIRCYKMENIDDGGDFDPLPISHPLENVDK